ncbi:hypothetical protein F2P79_015842 [Pimephales promelas]|nr:hypothetical protein F2P79_015842 [Pimephales promelas]
MDEYLEHALSARVSVTTDNLTSFCAFRPGERAGRLERAGYHGNSSTPLFLDDTKVKNFVTCFKDQRFLVFFFNRLKLNETGRYQQDFPFLSLCGRERNFVRCDDRPIVFTHLLSEAGLEDRLSYCGGGAKLTVPFQPERLFMQPVSGRLYHPGPERGGGVGLVRSALAIDLSAHFEFATGQDSSGQPTHFMWAGRRHTLTKDLATHFHAQKDST